MRAALLSCVLAVTIGGCGDDDEGPPRDGGRADASRPDSGPAADAGPPVDAGPRPDSGPARDAGPPTDAGPPVDSGPLDAGRVSMPCTAAGACDPFDVASCPAGQVCLPGTTDAGTGCRPGAMMPVADGAPCAFANDCAPGSMCVDYGDGFTCRRMCPAGSIGFCGGELRCTGTLAGEECVRVCRERAAPCDIYAQDCADPLDGCTFVFDGETDAPYTGCRTAGTRGDGETCGGGMGACMRGLVCIRSGDATTCRTVCRDGSTPACPAGQTCTGFARTWMVSYCESP